MRPGIFETLEHVALAITTIAAVIFGAAKLRRDHVETEIAIEQHDDDHRAEALRVKDELIEAMRQDREELKLQLKLANDRAAAAEQRAIKAEQRAEETRRRLEEFETESRRTLGKILEAMAASGRCQRAELGCATRIVPGSEVAQAAIDESPGGTD